MKIQSPDINLFIVGAAKSGTTSLYNYLNQHPDIYFPNVKELNFYSEIESDNPEDFQPPQKNKFYHSKVITDKKVYNSLFDGVTSESILADCSPSYLWDESASAKIFNDYPNAKIIILLRNPVERAFSHFLMDLKTGKQSERNFIEALLLDKSSLPKIWGKAHLYVELGMYSKQVEKYLKKFGTNQVKVILYENFKNDTKGILMDILEFLNVDKSLINNIDFTKIHNQYLAPKSRFSFFLLKNKKRLKGIKKRLPERFKKNIKNRIIYKTEEKPKLSLSDKKYLYDMYIDDIKRLEKLIDKDLVGWKIYNLFFLVFNEGADLIVDSLYFL
jgi:hypothetical protein